MDLHGSDRRPLDASGPREVVFCHQCEHDWYRDESGLICPNCDGEITEIVSPSSDPRPNASPPRPETPPEIRDFDYHYPWGDANAPDPDEEDIEEHMSQDRDGSSQWDFARRGHPRRQEARTAEDPSNVIRDFQSMISTLMGPNTQMGLPGRSGPDSLFNQDGITRNTYYSNGPNGSAQVTRITYRSPNLRPRDAGAPQAQGQRVEDISLLLGNLFNAMGPMGGMQHGHGHEDGARGNATAFPLGGLFAQLLNPANAAHGDAVFTQEALDRVISDLMEDHNTSNAPGPASPAAIASLPKKKLDEKMLGGDAKGECSVCMDDVHTGDEVVELPCHHWFHEACVGAWLGEHNTCPICRKGIEGDSPPAASPSVSRNPNLNVLNTPGSMDDNEARTNAVRARSEARLNSIRERNGVAYGSGSGFTVVRGIHGDVRGSGRSPSPPPMPGSYSPVGGYGGSERSSSFRRRNSSLSEGQSSSRSRRQGSDGGNGGVTGWLRDRFAGRRD